MKNIFKKEISLRINGEVKEFSIFIKKLEYNLFTKYLYFSNPESLIFNSIVDEKGKRFFKDKEQVSRIHYELASSYLEKIKSIYIGGSHLA